MSINVASFGRCSRLWLHILSNQEETNKRLFLIYFQFPTKLLPPPVRPGGLTDWFDPC